MFLVRILGIIDFLTGISLLLLNWDVRFFPIAFIAVFFVKTLLFISDIMSVIDLIAGILFVLALLGWMYNILTWFAILWFFYKGIISVFS